jgi:hypothetical protein
VNLGLMELPWRLRRMRADSKRAGSANGWRQQRPKLGLGLMEWLAPQLRHRAWFRHRRRLASHRASSA